MGYYPAFICENGHEITTLSNTCSDKYCSTCGAPVISKCPNCGSIIPGRPNDDSYGFAVDFQVPAYCRSCGKPYPWTSAAIEATVAMLKESDLSFDEQQNLIDILPDVTSETPRTQLASMRIQKAMATAGSFVAEGLRQFVIVCGCELIKKYLGLS